MPGSFAGMVEREQLSRTCSRSDAVETFPGCWRERRPLLQAAELLIEKLSYENALAEYFPRLVNAYDGDRGRAFSFDNIGELYLPPAQ
jgi:hypothetical protein